MVGVAGHPLTTFLLIDIAKAAGESVHGREGGAQAAGSRCAPAGIRWEEVDSILKPNTPYKLAWVPDGAPIPELMVVPLPTGPEKIDQRRYLELMSLRLSDLLEAQDDPRAGGDPRVRCRCHAASLRGADEMDDEQFEEFLAACGRNNSRY
jgi:hypothetical protein